MSADRSPQGAGLQRPHVWRPGPGQPPLLLLHGTGGDEHSLVSLGKRLAPTAPLLSPRGTVVENGTTTRFFRRIREGVIDEEDLRIQAGDLAAFTHATGVHHGAATGTWVAVGYSNGANMAAALMLLHPHLLAGAVLVAAMPPFRHGAGAVDLTGKRIAVVYGLRDRVVPARRSRELASQLRHCGAEVVELAHKTGHVVAECVLPEIRQFILGASGAPQSAKPERPSKRERA